MTPDQKQAAFEFLRSCALEAHQAIVAIKLDNYGEARDLIDDATRDLEKARELLPEES